MQTIQMLALHTMGRWLAMWGTPTARGRSPVERCNDDTPTTFYE